MLNDLASFLSNPVVWKVIAFYWVFSAVIGALPTPKTDSNGFYVFMFRFGHGLSGNLNRAAVALKVPGAKEQPEAT